MDGLVLASACRVSTFSLNSIRPLRNQALEIALSMKAHSLPRLPHILLGHKA